MKALFTALFLLIAGIAHGESWRFALIGDTPYNDSERRNLPHMLRQIGDENPAFIIHAGDFKNGRANCSDTLFRDRYTLFDASSAPFIYVPGDNEWSDCSRVAAGRYDPRERLGKLREIFFSEPASLGKKRIDLERQPGTYREHLRWQLGPVLFVTLNVPGGNNNREVDDASPEFDARNPVVIDWIKQGFAKARQDRLAGIVLVMQANPDFPHFAAGLGHSGYRELLETLRSETLAFDGQVLLVHGDSHWQRVDQPLRHPASGQPIANFTRAETYGYPIMGWVKVVIDDTDPRTFRFEARPYQ